MSGVTRLESLGGGVSVDHRSAFRFPASLTLLDGERALTLRGVRACVHCSPSCLGFTKTSGKDPNGVPRARARRHFAIGSRMHDVSPAVTRKASSLLVFGAPLLHFGFPGLCVAFNSSTRTRPMSPNW